jgi:hypothetical protein
VCAGHAANAGHRCPIRRTSAPISPHAVQTIRSSSSSNTVRTNYNGEGPTAGIERIERLAAENGRLRAAIKEAQEAIEKHSIANGVESPEPSGALHLSALDVFATIPCWRNVRAAGGCHSAALAS